MWKTVTALVASAGVLIAVPSFASHGQRPDLSDRAEFQLRQLENDIAYVRNPELRARMQQRVDRLELIISRVDRIDDVRQGPGWGQPPPRMLGFEEARRIIAQESFESGRLDAVRRVAGSGRFTTMEARELANQMWFDSGKKDALIALYPAVTDKQRFMMALDILSFGSSRRDVMRAVGI